MNIFIDLAVNRELPLIKNILRLNAPENIEFLDIKNSDSKIINSATSLIVKNNPETTLKKCPGTPNYLCCDYSVLLFAENCPFNCHYCILNAYFESKINVLFADVEKMVRECEKFLDSNRYLRLGTGEFADSLAMEPYTGFSKLFLTSLYGGKNKSKSKSIDSDRISVEFKTKSCNIDSIINSGYKKNIVLSWSLNAHTIWKVCETGTPSVNERLDAAVKAVEAGYKVAFHFDPVVIFDNWRVEYGEVINLIFNKISDISRIAFVSVGVFRFIPALKHHIQKNFSENSFLLKHEFVTAMDSKMRYPYENRKEVLQFFADSFKNSSVFLYYCMESERAWQETLGFSPKDDNELGDMLWQAITKN